MKPVLVIPCMDILDGRIVKGVRFRGMRDAGDPVEAAIRYSEQGADEVWMLDIAASMESRSTRMDVVRNVAKACAAPLGVGGGIRSLEDVETLAAAGARRIGIGSAALKDPQLIRRASYKLGRERVVALVDVRRDGNFIEVMGAGQVSSGREMAPWLKELEELGAGAILLTSMQDGTREGYDLVATRAAAEAVSIPVIASGGAGKLEHFYDAATEGKAGGVLAASVFHFGELTIGQVKEHLKERGIEVADGAIDLSMIRFDEKGLVPAIAQDFRTGQVLMQAYMNQEALRETLRTGEAVYYSRSRQQLWHKGETSGNTQKVVEVDYDCDADSILLRVVPAGPACHTGATTCFHNVLMAMDAGGRSAAQGVGILQALYGTILDRSIHPKEGSYTNRLFSGGVDRIGKKVIEEAAEVVLAAKNDAAEEVRFEAADLLYHLLVLLAQQGVSPDDVYAELQNRHGVSAKEEG